MVGERPTEGWVGGKKYSVGKKVHAPVKKISSLAKMISIHEAESS